eukprot:TRINITY_DN17872_c0_g1_i1.p1 TRINITY_DN17872_c0_g1~~TRINITY_DN17872_c0_g1_i1.p1  ORF type:complete len:148 (+),score=17.90 TRINITY_DN17872_c0_g1_i1:115-558(+)
MKKLLFVDGLRVVMSMTIVLSHTSKAHDHADPYYDDAFAAGSWRAILTTMAGRLGFWAVVMFFVMGGFVRHYTALSSSSPPSAWGSRFLRFWCRIVPSYYLSLAYIFAYRFIRTDWLAGNIHPPDCMGAGSLPPPVVLSLRYFATRK